MSKYIDADALMNQRPENLNNRCENYDKAVYASGWNDCNECWCDLIDEMPAADVEPVIHGVWVNSEFDYARCSECAFEQKFQDYTTPFCPNCGAKMDRGSK